MAKRTLGDAGATAVSVTYALLHYTLLVAYISKAGSTIADASDGVVSATQAGIGFTLVVGGMCYAARPNVLDGMNGVLVVGVLGFFFALLGLSAGGLDSSLLVEANWEALPAALPTIALAFVFQNVVPGLYCSFVVSFDFFSIFSTANSKKTLVQLFRLPWKET